MTTSNRLFGNISNIYTAVAQSQNILATAHHKIIFLMRISQLFVYNKSIKYFTNGNRLNI